MKNKLLLLPVVMLLGWLSSATALAQTETSTPPTTLDAIRIGNCNPQAPLTLEKLIAEQRKRGLVLDVRPSAINQATGKMHFDGDIGRVTLVHINPFVYKYNISVAQEELVSTAVSDFINILVPPGLRSIGKAPEADATASPAPSPLPMPSNLLRIETRVKEFGEDKCTTSGDVGCRALKAMKDDFDKINTAILGRTFSILTPEPPEKMSELKGQILILHNDQADAQVTCQQATTVNAALDTSDVETEIKRLEPLRKRLTDLTNIANDLIDLANQYFDDDELKTYTVRCGGFNCARQFKDYAEGVVNLLSTELQPRFDDRMQTWQEFEALLKLTNKMKQRDGVFARTFEVKKKYELSAATISITREELEKKDKAATAHAAAPPKADKPAEKGDSNHADKDAGDKKADDKKEKSDDPEPEKPKPVTPDINESIQIGRPRFNVSGGLVYSPLDRQSFVTTSGFTHDANGNPTGDGNTKVVAFDENSSRRLLPMVFLNSRVASFSRASVFFSLGVTAKKDKDIDVEYLLGPSVSMLNDRAMFTFGAYAGKGERLVPDVRIGDAIPDDAGNAQVSTKHYTWKPGFSFSYVFSNLTKSTQEGAGGGGGGGGGSSSAADDLKDEIRIGGIPFNLAMGLAYTSLEDQTFAPILGHALDRQGNLTNGQTLTRIVGLSTSSNYRLVPLAMLHSRLLNFGKYSFYLTSGVTGKKDDDKVEIEYLLGGSVNLYKRKLFFTFGTFAGKQQRLAGDLFLGGKLASGQDVGVERRYVWKPAFAFSYDISKIVPGGSKK